jgi:hypothetical protein
VTLAASDLKNGNQQRRRDQRAATQGRIHGETPVNSRGPTVAPEGEMGDE